MDNDNLTKKIAKFTMMVDKLRGFCYDRGKGVSMKEIELTGGKYALVDDEDYEWLSRWKWRCTSGYATRSSPRQCGKRPTILMHRLILGLSEGEVTDHINHNGLDNRRCNLRRCTSSENAQNSLMPESNSSGYMGVIRNKGKWVARIRYDGESARLGQFDTAEEAARVYDIAALELHKEFATTNFPDTTGRLILLSNGRYAIVDSEDYEQLSKWEWDCVQGPANQWYVQRTDGQFMGHLILGGIVNHINGNELDNRRSNLQLSTHTEKLHIRLKQTGNTSGYIGVDWRPANRKWRAQIAGDPKRHIGLFDTPEEAAHAYDEAAKKYHGDFATLNFPDVQNLQIEFTG